MGLIRTLLAIAVVVYHSYHIFGERLVGGTVAVQAFYMISGFYMALILNEKYVAGKGSWRLFISNRLLRLFPAYWIVLLLAIVVSVIGHYFWNQPFYLYAWKVEWGHMTIGVILLAVIANLFMLGSDWMFFTGINRETGMLELTKDCFSYKPMTFQLLFVPQIWTLGIELMFYILAPFVVRRKWYWQVGLVLASLGYRYYFYTEKYWSWDPWSYRFFPFELALFIAGSLAYQVYRYIREKNIPVWVMNAMWITVLVLIWYYPHADYIREYDRRWYFYAVIFIFLPFIFLRTKNIKWDRWIGELSFPIYIGHHLIMMIIKRYFWTHTEHMDWFGISSVAGSVIFALFLWKFVVEPIERYRQKRVSILNPLQ